MTAPNEEPVVAMTVRWPSPTSPARRIALSVACGFGMAGTASLGPAQANEPITYFRIGTGGSGGTYFPIGTIIANAISRQPGAAPCDRGGSCGVEGLIATAVTSQGSVQNVRDLRAGRIQAALVQSDVAFWAWRGQRQFRKEGASAKLRVIANLYQELVHLVVRRDAKIRTVKDLAGKRISLGEVHSGTLVHARIILRAFGLSERRTRPQYYAASYAAQALAEGKLDAFFLVAGYPAASIATLAEQTDIDLIAISGAPASRARKRFPFLATAAFPPNAYSGAEAISTLSVSAQLIVSADTSEKLVYQITRALWNKRTGVLLRNGHPTGKKIQLKTALEGVSLPFHPGAARYYRERGLLKGKKQDKTPISGKTTPGGKKTERN